MTRLEKQIADKQQELREMIDFSSKKLAIFNTVQTELVKVLRKYGVIVTDWDNQMIEKTTINAKWIVRIWLQADSSHLSDTRKKNLEKALRNIVPMPLCPIARSTISIVYHG